MSEPAKKVEHTQGPWKFLDTIGSCEVYAGNRQLLRYGFSPDAENRANARLMAAAPELLEAAEKLLEWMPVCSEGSSGYMRAEKLKAAIKKARAGGG